LVSPRGRQDFAFSLAPQRPFNQGPAATAVRGTRNSMALTALGELRTGDSGMLQRRMH